MTIKICKIDENYSKNYYNELLTILKFYKKIQRKPILKVLGLCRLELKVVAYYQSLIITFMVFPLFFHFYYQVIILISLFLLLALSLYISIRKIKFSLKKELKNCKEIKDTSVIIDNNEIIKCIDYNNESKTFSINWNNVEYVIINNYTIIFMPKWFDPLKETIICIPAIDKNKIIPYLKKIGKENIIIDNSKLYNKKKNLKSIISTFKLDVEIWFYKIK